MLIRVSIIAPAIAIRAGLKALLNDEALINVIAEATSLTEIAEAQIEADVIVWSPASSMDLASMRAELSKLKVGEVSALLLVYDDPEVIDYLIRLPIRTWGLLDPEATQSELIASLQALNEGLIVTHPTWLKQVFKSPTISKDGNNGLIEALTVREVEILQLLALGLTNKQIAGKLRISAHTVKFHVSTIFSKLGTTNRVETVNLGLTNGLIVL